MGTNLDKMKQRLKSLQEATNKTSGLWRPTGKHQVRIVPYKFNKENPFIELWFHYDLGGKNYLSPKSFGDPDPILEFSDKLKATGDPESYKLSRKLMPKLRTYVPIVVRGEESQGVKFWGFGKNNYEEIMQIMTDEEYGDIVDPVTGTDLEVSYTSPEESGTTYGKINVIAKRTSTKLSDNAALLDKLMNDQKNITDIYKVLTYDELKDALEEWLNSMDDDGGDTVKEEESISVSDIESTDVEKATEDFAKLFTDESK